MDDIQSEINLARIIASQNKLNEAIKILKGVIKKEPHNEDAWLALSEVVQDPEHVKKCLERVLQLDPRNPIARRKFEKLTGPELETLSFLQGTVESNVGKEPPQYLYSQPEKEKFPLSPERDFPLQPNPYDAQIAAEPQSRQTKDKTNKKTSGRTLEFALMGLTAVIVLVIIVVAFLPSGSSLIATKPTPTVEDPIAVIHENMRAANAEDLDAYLATIYPRTLVLMSTESTLKELNDTYDLQYQVSNLSILEQDKKEAKVSFVLTTRKIRGPDFRNNRIIGVFILRMHEGHWKIYSQEIEKVDYID